MQQGSVSAPMKTSESPMNEPDQIREGDQPITTGEEGWSSRLVTVSFWAEWASVVGLIGLVALFSVLDTGFLSAGNIAAIFSAAAILMVLSIGQSFVIMTGGIDLSVASVMTFSAVVLGVGYVNGLGLALSCLLAVTTGLAAGIVNGLLIGKGRITDFVVTLGALSAANGLALIVSDGKPNPVTDIALLKFATQQIGIFNWPFIVAAVLAILAHVVLFRTRFGTHVLATGGSLEAAQATGIRTQRIKIAVYAIAGLLAGVAALLLVARVGAAEPAPDLNFLLNSVAAVVLGGVNLAGGKGNIVGPIAGALLLTVLTNGLTLMSVSQYFQPLAIGIVVVLAAYLTRFRK